MKIAIIGGGAAGLFAAAAAKTKNPAADVTVLENGERVGKKILATGNGRCNLTNFNDRDDLTVFCQNYSDPKFAEQVFRKISPAFTDAVFADMGLAVVREENGWGYPFSRQANSVLDTLRLYNKTTGVRECPEFEAESIAVQQGGFRIAAKNGKTIFADKAILSCGGKSGGKCESFCRATDRLGLAVTPLVPSLVPFKCGSEFLRGLNGIRAQARLTLLDGKNALATECGEVLFKDYGVSGMAVFQLSHTAANLWKDRPQKQLDVSVDFLPDADVTELLKKRQARYGLEPAAELFGGIFPRRIGENILKYAGLSGTVREIPVQKAVSAAKNIVLEDVSPLPFDMSQVTAGGVCLDEVNADTMESRKIPGLYLAGEILDMSAKCGGYNLQWAWSTGWKAGSSAVD